MSPGVCHRLPPFVDCDAHHTYAVQEGAYADLSRFQEGPRNACPSRDNEAARASRETKRLSAAREFWDDAAKNTRQHVRGNRTRVCTFVHRPPQVGAIAFELAQTRHQPAVRLKIMRVVHCRIWSLR